MQSNIDILCYSDIQSQSNIEVHINKKQNKVIHGVGNLFLILHMSLHNFLIGREIIENLYFSAMQGNMEA